MVKLIFAPRVGDDLRGIGDWIARDNPERALTFVLELIAACHTISDFPRAYPAFPLLGPNARRYNHRAYAILDNVIGDVVTILAIVHGARDLRPLDF